MTELLFKKGGQFSEYLDRKRTELKDAIESYDKNNFLNTDENELIDYFYEKHTIEIPVLLVDQKYMFEPKEADIDVSEDRRRDIRDRSRPFYIKGSSFNCIIPFQGDAAFFNYQPSTFTFNPPRAIVKGQELIIEVRTLEPNNSEISRYFEEQISEISSYLGYLKRDADQFNTNSRQWITELVTYRKKRLNEANKTAKLIGIPIIKVGDYNSTLSIPIKPKKVVVQPVARNNYTTPSEYILSPEMYDNILESINNMALVFEKSPSAFRNLEEEAMRFLFLIPLNAMYGLSASGETFNFKGKTDILITWEGKNVFIAECKFWEGEKAFNEAIDQVLSYLSWRDTKTALIIFNRNKNFSKVLTAIQSAVTNHSCFSKEIGKKSETIFQYTFHHPEDSQRAVHLAVMAFDVPV